MRTIIRSPMAFSSRRPRAFRHVAVAATVLSLFIVLTVADRDVFRDQAAASAAGPTTTSSKKSSYRQARSARGEELPTAAQLAQAAGDTAAQVSGVGSDALKYLYQESYPMMMSMSESGLNFYEMLQPAIDAAERYPANVVPNMASAQFMPLQNMIPQTMQPAGSTVSYHPQQKSQIDAMPSDGASGKKFDLGARAESLRQDLQDRVSLAEVSGEVDRLARLSQMRDSRDEALEDPRSFFERRANLDGPRGAENYEFASSRNLMEGGHFDGLLSGSRGINAKLAELSDLERLALLQLMQQKFGEDGEDRERRFGDRGILGGRKLQEVGDVDEVTDIPQNAPQSAPFAVPQAQLLQLVAQAMKSSLPVTQNTMTGASAQTDTVDERRPSSTPHSRTVDQVTASINSYDAEAATDDTQPPPRSRRFDPAFDRIDRDGLDWAFERSRWDFDHRRHPNTGTSPNDLKGASAKPASYSPYLPTRNTQDKPDWDSQCFEKRDFKTPDGKTVQANLPCGFVHLYEADNPAMYSPNSSTGMAPATIDYSPLDPVSSEMAAPQERSTGFLDQIRGHERGTRSLGGGGARFSSDAAAVPASSSDIQYDLDRLAAQAASFGIDPMTLKSLSVSGLPIQQLIADATPSEIEELLRGASSDEIESLLAVHSKVADHISHTAFDMPSMDALAGQTATPSVHLTPEQLQMLGQRQQMFNTYASSALEGESSGEQLMSQSAALYEGESNHLGSSSYSMSGIGPSAGLPFGDDFCDAFCQCPEDGLDSFMDALSVRQRIQLRSYLRDLGYYEYRRRRSTRERFTRERNGRSRSVGERKRFNFNRIERQRIRNRYGCKNGRIRRQGRCSKIRAPLHKCDAAPTVYTSPTCYPQAVSNSICGDGFNLDNSKCTLQFDTMSSCPDGTQLNSGKCTVTGVYPSSYVSESNGFSRMKMESSLYDSASLVPAAPVASSINAPSSYNVGYTKLSASVAAELCPSDTVHYVDQCVPATGRRVAKGRRQLARSVLAVCPSGFVPVDSLGLSRIAAESMIGPQSSSQDMMCARIVPADLSCPDGFEMVEKRKAIRDSEGSRDSEMACQRNIRSQAVTTRCGPGLTLTPDGTTCVGKKRVAFSKMCEKGRLDGDRCVDYVAEQASLGCPPGYQLEQHGMEQMCVETQSGRGRNLHDHPGIQRRARPNATCRDPSAKLVSRDTCVRPVSYQPKSYCSAGRRKSEDGHCYESVTAPATVLCRSSDGQKLTDKCVERRVERTRKSCPTSTVPLCAEGVAQCESSSCLQTRGAVTARSNATGRPLDLRQAQRIGRHLLESTGESHHVMEFCPVGSELVTGPDEEFCQIVTAPVIPSGCTKANESCPSGKGYSLCPDGYAFEADGRLCVEEPDNTAPVA